MDPNPPSPDRGPLANVVWHALDSRLSAVAVRSGRAARFDPEVSVFAGAEALDASGWRDLAEVAGPGGTLVLFRAEVPEPPVGWTVARRGQAHQMVMERAVVEAETIIEGDDLTVRDLAIDDVPAMTQLVALTQPGPWCERTIELGGYVGALDSAGRLLAMAGRRIAIPGFVEISAVCTHPDGRGRGLAGALTMTVARNVQTKGETAFLHVSVLNESAKRVYDRLGFVTHQMVEFVAMTAPT